MRPSKLVLHETLKDDDLPIYDMDSEMHDPFVLTESGTKRGVKKADGRLIVPTVTKEQIGIWEKLQDSVLIVMRDWDSLDFAVSAVLEAAFRTELPKRVANALEARIHMRSLNLRVGAELTSDDVPWLHEGEVLYTPEAEFFGRLVSWRHGIGVVIYWVKAMAVVKAF